MMIERWIERVINVADDGLESHSPSRIFAQLGAGIPEGLAEGFPIEDQD